MIIFLTTTTFDCNTNSQIDFPFHDVVKKDGASVKMAREPLLLLAPRSSAPRSSSAITTTPNTNTKHQTPPNTNATMMATNSPPDEDYDLPQSEASIVTILLSRSATMG